MGEGKKAEPIQVEHSAGRQEEHFPTTLQEMHLPSSKVLLENKMGTAVSAVPILFFRRIMKIGSVRYSLEMARWHLALQIYGSKQAGIESWSPSGTSVFPFWS
jgi:hypothetical protein